MNTQVIVPKVDANICEAPIPISRVVMTLTAGGLSTCQVSGQVGHAFPDEASVKSMLDAEIAKTIGGMQEKIFANRGEPDSSVTIQDGLGATVTFKGYFSNPSYSNSPGSTGMNYVVVHESAILSAFQGSIYSTSPTFRDAVAGGGPFDLITSNNMAWRLNDLIDTAVKEWQRYPPTTMGPDQLEILNSWHALNEKIKPKLLAALIRSKIDYPSMDFVDKNKADNAVVNTFMLKQIVLAHGSSFLQNLQVFERAFQCIMLPRVRGNDVAYFIKQSAMMDNDNSSPLYIPAVDVNYSGGDRRLLPISSVVIQTDEGTDFRDPVAMATPNNTQTNFWTHPRRPTSGGDVLYDSGPPWLEKNFVAGSDTAGEGAQRGFNTQSELGLSIDNWQSSKADLIDFMIEVNDTAHMPVIKEWAKNLYESVALEGSSATLSIPMSVPMEPGFRYEVFNTDGRPLFRGFLQQVTHNMSMEARPPQASTTLSFSHIEAGGFNLPS